MNLKLQAFKNNGLSDYTKGNYVKLVVVDLDKSEHYPENYVCRLPQGLRAGNKPHARFSKLFGDKSLKLAQNLLREALETRENSEIKEEIKRRLTLLEPNAP